MDPIHQRALAWFHERTGEVVPWPEPLPGTDLLLAQRAKGIHKPRGWEHALSVRVIPAGRYPDEEPQPTGDGGWAFRYSQEEPAGADPALHFTNRALARCMEDGTPVGVLRQVSGKPAVRYEVLGLATVTAWEGGFFTLRGPAALLGTGASAAAAAEAAAETFDPTSLEDAREKTVAAITRRRGQPAFRAALLRAYRGRCAISGCAVEGVLEAAHIVPYLGPKTNAVSNGLLLRSDLHTLFDLGLLWVDPERFTVEIAESLEGSSYRQLRGRALRLPSAAADRPSPAALKSRAPGHQARPAPPPPLKMVAKAD